MSEDQPSASDEPNRPQLQRIIADLSEGVILIETDRRIIWANDAALKMHGVRERAELGTTVDAYAVNFKLQRRDDKPLARGDYPAERVCRGEEFSDLVVHLADPGDPALDWFHKVRGLELKDEHGRPDCYALVITDATEAFEAEERFERLCQTKCTCCEVGVLARPMPRRRQPPNPFRYFNSSPEVIRLVVMMYVRYPLSLRNVEDLLHQRGIEISHETVRFWWNRFGPMFAAEIRRKRVDRMRAFTHWKWHLDEVYVKISGEMHYLWRAVDHEGEVLESYITKTRDKAAALAFIKKALKRHGSPEAITTDGLRSYKAALNEIGNAGKQEVGRWANNRAENSHLPFRRRERAMLRFRRMKTLQKFTSVHASFHNHFNQDRHLTDRETYKANRSAALAEWMTLAG